MSGKMNWTRAKSDRQMRTHGHEPARRRVDAGMRLRLNRYDGPCCTCKDHVPSGQGFLVLRPAKQGQGRKWLIRCQRCDTAINRGRRR